MAGSPAPRLVCLHALGASSRSFDLLADALGEEVEVLALDLPGFGDEPWHGGGCAATVASVVRRLADLPRDGRPLVLLGHSMGAKIVLLLAAGVVAARPAGLASVVLVAGSPVTPEPMPEEKRAEMVAVAHDDGVGPDDAAAFVDDNCAQPLPAPLRDRAVADVRRSDPAAWRAWFASGSREDWDDQVGRLALPALVVAGSEDGDLGPEAQRRLTADRLPQAHHEVVDGAAHLVPLEQPTALADLVRAHLVRSGAVGTFGA